MKVTYSHTGFHNDQASYFSMKVLAFAEPGHLQFLLKHCYYNLSYDQQYCPFSDQINITCDLQLLSLVQRLRYVHHS